MSETRTISTTRPATVVTPIIKIDEVEIARTFQLDAIDIRKEVNRIPSARVVLLDGEASEEKFKASNDSLFIPGKKIEIKAGYESDNHTLFKGIIIKHSIKMRGGGNSILVLECKDLSVKMTIGRKSKYFDPNISDSDAITELISAYSGITPEVESTSVTHKDFVQYQSTDWDFILSRAEANGLLVFPDDGKLVIKKPDLSQEPVQELLFGATITEIDAEIDARNQYSTVTARAWSFSDQQLIEAEAADPGVSLYGNLSSSNLASVVALKDFRLDHGGRISENELQAWSDAMMLRSQLARVRGRVKFKGVHTVKPGHIIKLGGLSDRFNGKAFVSGIRHTIAAGDWQIDVQFGLDPDFFAYENDIHSKPAASLLSGVCGLQIAKVTALEGDPDGENRIQVHMPLVGNEEGVWARIATLDAGNERGSFFLPEIDDEVILGFVNDDPRDAVILGMLHSSSLPAPLPAADTNHQKGFVTRSKIKMIFDDEKKSFTLETPKGKKIIVDDDGDSITLQDNYQNKIVMDSNGITLESNGAIKMKAQKDFSIEGLNTTMKGSASVKVEAQGTLEAKSSGTATLKGSMVQIN